MSKSVIELNGQLYDTATGRLVKKSAEKQVRTKPVSTAKPKHIDGFVRKTRTTTDISHKIPSQKTSQQTPNNINRRGTQKSKTLMRSTVSKPKAAPKLKTTVVPLPQQAKTSQPKPNILTSKPGRLIRATGSTKSSLISKFGSSMTNIKSDLLPVTPPPIQKTTQTSQAHTPKTNISTPAKTHAATANHSNIFESTLDSLTNHEAKPLKKPSASHRIAKKLRVHPRVVHFASIALIAITVSGFIAYQNLPGVAMRIAASRAGFTASLPTYKPAGYAMNGPIKYQPGEISIDYKSTSDDRSFSVTQKNSSWNSGALLDNYVAVSGTNYQTIQANGRTIYVYDGNKATWVDGGVWYSIDGKSNLNSDQLLRIAKSL